MIHQMSWIKSQIKDKKFRLLLIIIGIASILLILEFILLQYGVLKICRYLILLAGLLVIVWIDVNEKRIPNKILAALFLIRIFILVLESIAFWGYGLSILFSAAMGGLAGGGMFLLVYLLSRGGIGMGDVKLFAVLGLYMGIGSVFIVVFFTVISSAIYSVIMLIRRKIKLKEEIPYAPFVMLGVVLSMALGA